VKEIGSLEINFTKKFEIINKINWTIRGFFVHHQPILGLNFIADGQTANPPIAVHLSSHAIIFPTE
jgi:hypothetical protein